MALFSLAYECFLHEILRDSKELDVENLKVICGVYSTSFASVAEGFHVMKGVDVCASSVRVMDKDCILEVLVGFGCVGILR